MSAPIPEVAKLLASSVSRPLPGDSQAFASPRSEFFAAVTHKIHADALMIVRVCCDHEDDTNILCGVPRDQPCPRSPIKKPKPVDVSSCPVRTRKVSHQLTFPLTQIGDLNCVADVPCRDPNKVCLTGTRYAVVVKDPVVVDVDERGICLTKW